MKILIVIFVIVAILLLVTATKEKYWMSTYVMTPQRSGVYPTNVTDFYWWDRYIRRPQGYINYAAVPYRQRYYRRRPYWR